MIMQVTKSWQYIIRTTLRDSHISMNQVSKWIASTRFSRAVDKSLWWLVLWYCSVFLGKLISRTNFDRDTANTCRASLKLENSVFCHLPGRSARASAVWWEMWHLH